MRLFIAMVVLSFAVAAVAQKFPEAPSLAFLFQRYRATGDKTALRMATDTLDRMARGGRPRLHHA